MFGFHWPWHDLLKGVDAGLTEEEKAHQNDFFKDASMIEFVAIHWTALYAPLRYLMLMVLSMGAFSFGSLLEAIMRISFMFMTSNYIQSFGSRLLFLWNKAYQQECNIKETQQLMMALKSQIKTQDESLKNHQEILENASSSMKLVSEHFEALGLKVIDEHHNTEDLKHKSQQILYENIQAQKICVKAQQDYCDSFEVIAQSFKQEIKDFTQSTETFFRTIEHMNLEIKNTMSDDTATESLMRQCTQSIALDQQRLQRTDEIRTLFLS